MPEKWENSLERCIVSEGNCSENFTLKCKNVSNKLFYKISLFTLAAYLFDCNNWINAEWIFIKFDVGKFCKNLSN